MTARPYARLKHLSLGAVGVGLLALLLPTSSFAAPIGGVADVRSPRLSHVWNTSAGTPTAVRTAPT